MCRADGWLEDESRVFCEKARRLFPKSGSSDERKKRVFGDTSEARPLRISTPLDTLSRPDAAALAASAAKSANTAAILARFKEASGADERVIEKHWPEVERAFNQSVRLVARGFSTEAVDTLRGPCEAWCTVRTLRGANAMLQLALASDAAGDAESAKQLYAQLARSPIDDVKRRAKQLAYGFVAQETLGVSGKFAVSEASKLSFDFPDNPYASGGVGASPLRSQPILSRADARDALRRAARTVRVR